MTNNRIMVLIGLAFCIGCGGEISNEIEDVRTPAELVDAAIDQSEEFNFLLSEDAGSDSYKQCVDQIKGTVASLSESLASSELEQSQIEQLADAFEEVKAACEKFASTVEANAPPAKMSKSNSTFLKKLKAISKLFL